MTSALSLIGEPVCDFRGEKLGRVDDVFVDPVSGRLAFAILASGGFGRAERELRAVPWEAIRVGKSGKAGEEAALVLETGSESLIGAPAFARGETPDFSDPAFIAEIRRRYGVS